MLDVIIYNEPTIKATSKKVTAYIGGFPTTLEDNALTFNTLSQHTCPIVAKKSVIDL